MAHILYAICSLFKRKSNPCETHAILMIAYRQKPTATRFRFNVPDQVHVVPFRYVTTGCGY